MLDVNRTGGFADGARLGVPLDKQELTFENAADISPDSDGDGTINLVDNCPAIANAGQIDTDDDGFGTECDCADSDPAIWETPSQTINLTFGDSKNTLTWSPPDIWGTGAGGLAYDTLGSEVASDFAAAGTCIESNDATDFQADVSIVPDVGHVLYLLTRARNACPSGIGSLGDGSDGGTRVGRDCP